MCSEISGGENPTGAMLAMNGLYSALQQMFLSPSMFPFKLREPKIRESVFRP